MIKWIGSRLIIIPLDYTNFSLFLSECFDDFIASFLRICFGTCFFFWTFIYCEISVLFFSFFFSLSLSLQQYIQERINVYNSTMQDALENNFWFVCSARMHSGDEVGGSSSGNVMSHRATASLLAVPTSNDAAHNLHQTLKAGESNTE